jgi:phosphoribosylanthranilate isomerase
MRIKICGIRCITDAILAADAGADAIGILHGQKHPSPDFVDFQTAQDILRIVPPFVSAVLVTHLPEQDIVLKLVKALGVSSVQIHSNMPPEDVRHIRRAMPSLRILKSCHVLDSHSIDYDPANYSEWVDGFVLDTYNPTTGQVGGTGITHNWMLSRHLIEKFPDTPCILAGGLTSENVGDAITAVRPYAVDVNSGTKGKDGFKSPEKVKAFVQAVRLGARYSEKLVESIAS